MTQKIKRGFDLVIDSLCVLALGAMVIVVFYQVIARKILNNSPGWTGEISRYLLVWSIFLGGAIAFREKAHLGVDFLVNLFPKKIRYLIAFLVNCTLLVVLIYVAWKGFELAQFVHLQKAAATGISMAIPYTSIPVGCVCMIIEIVWSMAVSLRERWREDNGWKEGDPL